MNLDVNIKKKCLCIVCDLTNNSQINKALNKILKLFGGIDILIANSGAAFQGSMLNVKKDILEKSLEVNFYSHHNIVQKIANIMVSQGFGGTISLNLSKQSKFKLNVNGCLKSQISSNLSFDNCANSNISKSSKLPFKAPLSASRNKG